MVKESGYKERVLLEEFKREMNEVIRRKLIEAEMLQTQDFRVSQEKEPCIKVNTKELNRVSSTGLSILYTLNYWFMLHYH